MKIIIMRHGAATFMGADRVLSQEGVIEAHASARKICSQHTITKVLASPKTRAVQTAQILCENIKGYEIKPELVNDLSPSGNVSTVVDYVNAIAKDDDVIALVSHIPMVEYLEREFVHDVARIPAFVTAAALIVEITEGKGRALSFISPNNEILYV